MKVLVAMDGSAHGLRALDYVLSKPQMFAAAELVLMHVALPLPPRAAAAVGAEVVAAQHAHEHEEAMRAARQRLADSGLRAREVLEVGMPGPALAAEAERGGYDLVVMGSHGHGAALGLLLGSTVSKVLAASRVPLLVVR
ncbi:universal stress protein [Silanimonas lenta]|uniref:universal stress protein n=1 Tax=Silanimonas lenta TaxID=265429 RepID=UPI00048C3080|nr:universal stress protein [Silanimonas lenta]